MKWAISSNRVVQNWVHVLFPVSFLIFAIGFPLVYLARPLHHDEALFLVIAEQMTHGKTLYADVIDHKPPGIFAIAVVVTELVAQPHRVLRLLTYGVTAVSSVLVYHLGRTIRTAATGMIASLLFLLITYLPHFDGFFFLTEPWAVLTLVAATLLLFDDRTGSDALAGVSLGIGVLFNQTVFLFGLAIVTFQALTFRFPENRTSEYLRECVRRVLVIGLGFLGPVSLVLVFFYLQNTLTALLRYTMYVPATAYSTPFDLRGHLLALVTLLPVWLLAAWMLVRVGYEVVQGRAVSDEVLFVALWAGLLSVPGAVAFEGDHKFLLAFPAIALLTAIGLMDAYDRMAAGGRSLSALARRGPSRTTVVVAILLVTVVIAAGANVRYAEYRLQDDFASEAATADRIAERVDGPVYTYPPQGQFYYAADIELAASWPGQPYTDSLVAMTIADLERQDVQYVVVISDYMTDGTVDQRGYWAETKEPLIAYLNRHYEPVDEIDRYVILRRSDE